MSDTAHSENTAGWPGRIPVEQADDEGWVRGWPPPRTAGGSAQPPEQERARLHRELRKRTAWGMRLQVEVDDLRVALANACKDLVTTRRGTWRSADEAYARELAESYLNVARMERERREAEYEAHVEGEAAAERDAARPVSHTGA